jgi:hypothetical protein
MGAAAKDALHHAVAQNTNITAMRRRQFRILCPPVRQIADTKKAAKVYDHSGSPTGVA